MDGGESKLGPVQAKQSTRIGHLYAVYAGRAGMPHTRNQPRYIQNRTGHRRTFFCPRERWRAMTRPWNRRTGSIHPRRLGICC